MPFLIVRNDITKMDVDVIVNSANPQAIIGGGVDYAIHKAGGEQLAKARLDLGPITLGTVQYTAAYNLKAKYVIHTVGPIWNENQLITDNYLRLCYQNSLNLAKELKCESIAFPLISTGLFGYPKEIAIDLAMKEIELFLLNNEMEIYLVVYDNESYMNSKSRKEVSSYIQSHEVKNRQRTGTYMEINFVERHKINSTDVLTDKFDFDEIDESFQKTLFKIIDKKKMTDTEVYKRANIDRKLFSKIRSNENYKPSKNTAIALCIGLLLDLKETKDLMNRAGYSLSRSFRFDVIVEKYIESKNYNINEINLTLFEFDLELLGQS